MKKKVYFNRNHRKTCEIIMFYLKTRYEQNKQCDIHFIKFMVLSCLLIINKLFSWIINEVINEYLFEIKKIIY